MKYTNIVATYSTWSLKGIGFVAQDRGRGRDDRGRDRDDRACLANIVRFVRSGHTFLVH